MRKQTTSVGGAFGFTLIELLVVIAVVSVLVAMLFPVFVKARDRAHMAVCASNLHQVALALRMYANDWDGEYPSNNTYELRQRKRLAWDLLIPYTHSRGVFHCPDERGPFDKALGYEYRGALWNDPAVQFQRPPRPDSGTVVAYCMQHTERSGEDGWVIDASGHEIGPLIVAREDGSMSRVLADRVDSWAYQSGQWSQTGAGSGCPAEAVCMERFPGEEWPPHL